MNENWSLIKSRFDREATQFSLAAQATRSVRECSEAEDIVWRIYHERQKELEAAIAEVAAFVPETDEEANARLDVGGAIMSLCHSLDETWLEYEALEILPPQSWSFPDAPLDGQRAGRETIA